MNVQTPGFAIRTADDFLRWNEGREGKREFVGGRVVEMMTGVTQNHNRVATNLVIEFGKRLDRERYDFGTADYGVRTPRGIRYPDLYVQLRGSSGRDLATETPLLVAEILSPSSMALDFGPKAAEYKSMASLRHYLVLSQDEPRAWLWTREDQEFPEPEMLAGPDATLALPAFGITLSLADLYRGIA